MTSQTPANITEQSTKTPQVSIGMPVYNGESFIREALDSLLAQTFTDFELIISDNASTDGTEAICREYAAKDDRIRYVRQAENRGGLANFQFVLDEAVGEYFMWAAADDRWDVRWIESLFPVVSLRQCLAYGFVATIDEQGIHLNHPSNNRKFEYRGNVFIRRLKYFLEPDFLGKPNPIYGLMPKRILTPEAFSALSASDYGADMLFLFSLLANVEIASVPSVRLEKRIHADSVGAGIVTDSKQRPAYITRILRFGFNLFKARVTEVIQYRRLSHGYEHFMYILLMPLTLLLNLYCEFYFRLRKREGDA
jgi:glycosyltransferase involved in cell wall biosynthesis